MTLIAGHARQLIDAESENVDFPLGRVQRKRWVAAAPKSG
jgi:hypothetical protein